MSELLSPSVYQQRDKEPSDSPGIQLGITFTSLSPSYPTANLTAVYKMNIIILTCPGAERNDYGAIIN